MTASGLQIVFSLDEIAFVQNLVFFIESAYCTPVRRTVVDQMFCKCGRYYFLLLLGIVLPTRAKVSFSYKHADSDPYEHGS